MLRFEPFQLLNVFRGSLSSVLLPGCGLLVLAATPRQQLARIPVCMSLLAFMCWTAISLIWTQSPSATEFAIRGELVPLVIVMCVAGTLRPALAVRALTIIVTTIVIWSAFSSFVLPSSQAVVLNERGDQQVGFRGTFGHKNLLGVFTVYALCLILPFARGRYRRLLIVGTIALVIATRSATAGSGLLIVVFIWLWTAAISRQVSTRQRSILLLSAIIAAIAAVIATLGLLPALLGLYQKDVTFSGRTIIWSEVLAVIGDRPFLGYGFDGFFAPTRPYVLLELQRHIGFDVSHAHSGVLTLLLEVGVVGLVLFALFIASVVRNAVNCLRRPSTVAIGQWTLLTVCAIAMMSVGEPLLQGAHFGWLAIVWVVSRRAMSDEDRLLEPDAV